MKCVDSAEQVTVFQQVPTVHVEEKNQVLIYPRRQNYHCLEDQCRQAMKVD